MLFVRFPENIFIYKGYKKWCMKFHFMFYLHEKGQKTDLPNIPKDETILYHLVTNIKVYDLLNKNKKIDFL